jgi:hypothetical protein
LIFDLGSIAELVLGEGVEEVEVEVEVEGEVREKREEVNLREKGNYWEREMS